MPNFLFEHAWPGMVLWGLLFVSDYTLTITCARLYRQQERIVFEGSYEITPFYQRDIDSLRVVSPRFVFILLLGLGLLLFLWLLNEISPAPELWQFVLGMLIGGQLAIHMRHFRNLILFRGVNHGDWVRGRIEYGRIGMLRASSWECVTFSCLYLFLFAFTGSRFILGAAVTWFLLAVKHRRLAGKLHRNLPRAAQPSEQI